MRVSEPDHPFYRPLWRRVALCVAVSAWAAYEVLVTGDPLWMMLTLGLTAYAVWTFLVTYRLPAEPVPALAGSPGDDDPADQGDGAAPSDTPSSSGPR